MVGDPRPDQQKGVLNNNSQWDADAHRTYEVNSPTGVPEAFSKQTANRNFTILFLFYYK